MVSDINRQLIKDSYRNSGIVTIFMQERSKVDGIVLSLSDMVFDQ